VHALPENQVETPQAGLNPPLDYFSLGFFIGRAPASEQVFAVALIVDPGDPRALEDEAKIDGRKRRIAGARGGEVQNPCTGQRIGAHRFRQERTAIAVRLTGRRENSDREETDSHDGA